MGHTVFCRKYQQALPGLTHPPLPGPKGQELLNTVSQRAWQEWQQLQTQLINEKHLSLVKPEARRYLLEQMEAFFDNRTTDSIEGFVPPNQAP